MSPKTYRELKQVTIWAEIAIMLFFLLLLSSLAHCEEIDLNIIAQIESSNNPLAINRRTQCYGLYQISQVCLTEYNQFHKADYTKIDLLNPDVNFQIAKWYIEKRIPQMLKYYRKPITVENLILAYNAGIRWVLKGKVPKETQKYIKKYRRLKYETHQ
jgi:soluble lytic murein transglycosylase-like protein